MHWEGIIRHYGRFFTSVPEEAIVTLLEGNTPLVPLPRLAGELGGWVTNNAGTGTISTIRCALRGDQHQHPVRVTMHQAGHGRMRILAARVAHLPGGGVGFLDARDDLLADGAVFIRRVNEVEEVGRDGQRQLVIGEGRSGQLLRQAGHRRQPFRVGVRVLVS